jgi:cadmium resistance protein CadD (predicted permease)
MLFGFLLLLLLALLAGVVAIGNVKPETSHGLLELIGILAVLAGAWSQWAFRYEKENKDEIEIEK